MPDLNLRDMPTRELFTRYQKQFKNINPETVLTYLDFEKTSSRAAQVVDQFLDSESLTESRFICLMLLYRQVDRPLKPSELAHGAGVKRGTITGVIDGLERSGWVNKIKNKDDKRSLEVSLSQQGIAKIERVLPQVYALDNQLMQGISTAEMTAFRQTLDKINQNITQMKNE